MKKNSSPYLTNLKRKKSEFALRHCLLSVFDVTLSCCSICPEMCQLPFLNVVLSFITTLRSGYCLHCAVLFGSCD
jgi:hypothetical protein